MLEITLFGPPRITVDRRPIEFDTRKAVALLADLAMNGGARSREQLAALLWPEYDDEHARGALRRTLSVMRSALGGAWLEIDRARVTLGSEVTCDVVRFRDLTAAARRHRHAAAEDCRACLARLDQAAALATDEFMAGFGLRDSPGFDDWQAEEREHLRHELASTLETLARGAARRGELGVGMEHAERLLRLDRLNEGAHRILMELRAWGGDRSAAMQQYRECVRVLDQELGVPPLTETTELYRVISENRLPPPAPAREAPRAAPVGAGLDHPLVGREAELASLRSAYEAVGPDGALLVIAGEAGIGKTRLAEEAMAHAMRQGGRSMLVRAHEGEHDLAYAPFVAALRACLVGDLRERLRWVPPRWLAEIVPLVPEVAELFDPQPSPIAGPGARGRLFEGVVQALSASLGGMPASVLVFDDLQWADTASLELLAYLANRLEGRSMLVLACLRDDPGSEHALESLFRGSRPADARALLRPGRLSREQIASLVPEEHRSAQLVDQLVSETEGLPYFVVEYLDLLAEGGLPEPPDTGQLPVPLGVRLMLEARLASISEAGRQLLGASAVLGTPSPPELLRDVSGRSEDETVRALEELVGRHMLEEQAGEGGLRYDLTHERLRSIIAEGTSVARRRLLHRRAAASLRRRARGAVERSAAMIAHHLREAGDEPQAAEYHAIAGEASRRVHANAEALGHFGMALALGHPGAADLHEAIGDLEVLGGRYDAAVSSYEAAAARLPAGEPPGRLAAIEHKLGALHHRRGEWQLAEHHLRAALAGTGPDDEERRARILADISITVHRRGQRRLAGRLARESLVAAERAGGREGLARAHNILGIIGGGVGHRARARQHLVRSLELATGLADPTGRIAALNNLALLDRADGLLAPAEERTREALAACVAQGDRHREAALRSNLADLLHARGRRDEAMAELKRSVVVFAEIGQAPALQPEIWKLVEW